MKNAILNLIAKMLPKGVVNRVNAPVVKELRKLNQSYSQNGEDMVLQRLFVGKKQGFFVDVGAHHPTRFSNTYRLYKSGWRGINIDAMPGSMEAFRKQRPNDINLEMGVSASHGSLTYHVFNEPALNTFSAAEAELKKKPGLYEVTQTLRIDTSPLGEILHKYVPRGVQIDFLSIDVEGLDIEVLISNDWNTYVPKVVCVELSTQEGQVVSDSTIYKFLIGKGYILVSILYNSLIFLKDGASTNSIVRI